MWWSEEVLWSFLAWNLLPILPHTSEWASSSSSVVYVSYFSQMDCDVACLQHIFHRNQLVSLPWTAWIFRFLIVSEDCVYPCAHTCGAIVAPCCHIFVCMTVLQLQSCSSLSHWIDMSETDSTVSWLKICRFTRLTVTVQPYNLICLACIPLQNRIQLDRYCYHNMPLIGW